MMLSKLLKLCHRKKPGAEVAGKHSGHATIAASLLWLAEIKRSG